jgi:2-dehydro-3-deoxyphosphogluconate aldolase/(4S)-4-hydroxy-2-oxoglutarate aldolase
MKATGATVLLGAVTPTEVMRATRLGADAVKIFPGSLVGPAYLKALRGPFGELALMPTGGVSVDNVGDWLAAGAFAVGAGGELVSAADIRARRWDVITASAERFTAALAAARATVAAA